MVVRKKENITDTVDIAQLQSQQWSVTFEKRLSEKLRVGMTGQVLTH